MKYKLNLDSVTVFNGNLSELAKYMKEKHNLNRLEVNDKILELDTLRDKDLIFIGDKLYIILKLA